ncbi:Putative helicase [hydrothermal vent metagenome]|uniref:Helicase n=1 Tax=hydrothermal vent metagenome TaxID=652676 RepID=A0A3B0UV31_9ZZZZ
MTQQQALDILKTGANVFLTGEPGSGKTYTVNKYVVWLREHGVEPAITASTGIAATHVRGMTIHSWSGIGVKQWLSEEDLDAIAQKEHVARRIKKTSVLIIDEISMLSSDTLAMVDAVCREVRHDAHVFGGMQVVLVGDFFQLPPITRSSWQNHQTQDLLFDNENNESVFAFSGDVWKRLNPLVCYLTEQHRQEDKAFEDILSAMRSGSVTSKHEALLEKRNVEPEGGTPVLFPHNKNVDRVNENELSKIEGTTRHFAMERVGPDVLTNALVRGCLSPETLSLKEGARVMFTKNNPFAGFVNGTLGTVVGFENGQPAVETYNNGTITVDQMEWAVEENGKVRAKIIQLPLRLAWAITVHKSQGMSLDAAHIDLSHAFEYGQGYVALSRVRSLSGLTISGFNRRALEVHPEVLEKDEVFREQSGMAISTFAEMPEKELSGLHARFLKAVGGSVKVLSEDEQHNAKTAREDPTKATLVLLREGKSIEEIAKARDRKPGTIITHLDKLRESGHISFSDVSHLARDIDTDIDTAFGAFKTLSTEKLSPVFSKLGGRVSYDTLRLARVLFLIKNGK